MFRCVCFLYSFLSMNKKKSRGHSTVEHEFSCRYDCIGMKNIFNRIVIQLHANTIVSAWKIILNRIVPRSYVFGIVLEHSGLSASGACEASPALPQVCGGMGIGPWAHCSDVLASCDYFQSIIWFVVYNKKVLYNDLYVRFSFICCVPLHLTNQIKNNTIVCV